jgi:hypothetical protein
MDFFLVFCKNRKKYDKYAKINKLRNKCVVDIKKMMEDEQINLNKPGNAEYFKILVFKKIQVAAKKKRDIYYIPNFDLNNPDIMRFLKIKDLLVYHNFNLLFFYNEFKDDQEYTDRILNLLSECHASQIIKDY